MKMGLEHSLEVHHKDSLKNFFILTFLDGPSETTTIFMKTMMTAVRNLCFRVWQTESLSEHSSPQLMVPGLSSFYVLFILTHTLSMSYFGSCLLTYFATGCVPHVS